MKLVENNLTIQEPKSETEQEYINLYIERVEAYLATHSPEEIAEKMRRDTQRIAMTEFRFNAFARYLWNETFPERPANEAELLHEIYDVLVITMDDRPKSGTRQDTLPGIDFTERSD